MSKRKSGWRVIKTLTAEETRRIRETTLLGAAATHAELGAPEWAAEYARRAGALQDAKPEESCCGVCPVFCPHRDGG